MALAGPWGAMVSKESNSVCSEETTTHVGKFGPVLSSILALRFPP